MLAHQLRRLPNIESTMGERLEFAGLLGKIVTTLNKPSVRKVV